jgi:sensor histidine kinase YesM
LTLQPLLENAVAHGIQPRPEGGELRVYGRAEADNIVITIVNPLGPDEHVNKGPAASLITEQNEEQFFAVLSLPYVENTDN